MTKTYFQFFIFAGEPSGDLHGANLIQALKNDLTEAKFAGVGGPEMRAQGMQNVLQMEDFVVMGFSDVLRSFPKLYKQFYIVHDFILRHNPPAVILIDYPGFNLRLSKALRKKGYAGKIIHYISPSVWAWGKGRIEQMAKDLDLLLTIYPFEASAFSHTPLKVVYVGNPLQKYIQDHNYASDWKQELALPESSSIISLFPGSRRGEIERNLPKLLAAAWQVKKQSPNIIFAISFAQEHLKPMICQLIDQTSLKLDQDIFLIPKRYSYELMKNSLCAVAKSGTVTLELALHACPTVVVYHLSFLNWFIAKFIIRLNLPHYCIVNILKEKEIFPELIEKGFSPENLSMHIQKYITSEITRENCIAQCREVHTLLEAQNPSANAAKAILGLLA